MMVDTGENDALAGHAAVDGLCLAFRRRRHATLPARAALFALSMIAALAACGTSTAEVAAPAVTPPAAPSTAPSGPAAACTAAQMSGKVARAGSTASQPFDEIVLTNAGPSPCRLSGYPQLTAWGRSGNAPSAPLKTVLTRGSTYAVPDPGPRAFVVAPGRSAWFAISTGTAYGSALLRFDRVVIDISGAAGGKADGVKLALSMDATSPPGKAIPVKVTAFAPGVPPKP